MRKMQFGIGRTSAIFFALVFDARAQVVDTVFVDDFDRCGDEAQLIYAMDANNTLFRFDPRQVAGGNSSIQSLGAPACNTGTPLSGQFGDTATVFALAVDDYGAVWAMFNSGEIFVIDPATLNCTKKPWTSTQDWQLFNMTFSGNSSTRSQYLYVSGGGATVYEPGNLGRIDLTTLTVQTIDALQGSADSVVPLVSTGKREVDGLYPRFTSSTHIARIDLADGSLVGNSVTVPGLGSATLDWAIASWGGTFWVFLNDGTTTTLTAIDASTGASTKPLSNIPFVPVAANSSTCAPTVVN